MLACQSMHTAHHLSFSLTDECVFPFNRWVRMYGPAGGVKVWMEMRCRSHGDPMKIIIQPNGECITRPRRHLLRVNGGQ